MKKIKPISGEINILSTHGSVIDPFLREKLHTEQSPREVVIPNYLISDKDWSYTLLGHIHERGWVGSKDQKTDTAKKRIYYNGSLIRRGFSDKAVPLGRGWTLWTIKSDGKFTSEAKTVFQRPQIDFSVIDTEDLSSSEISELIVNNLKKTQKNDIEFDQSDAPLLRQRLLNITTSKYSSLDWKAIHQNSQHALQWSLKKITNVDLTESANSNILSNEAILNSGDVVKVYDDWVKNSQTLSETDESLREFVQEQSRNFIKQGQETSIESD
jgi:hypothetical protein